MKTDEPDMLKKPGTRDGDRDQTISDFGEQWTRHTDNPDYYGSVELFADIIAPFLTLEDIKDRNCADIGSGTGRIVLMMLAAGAASVVAIEPSRAYDVLVRNTAHAGERVRCLNVTGEAIPKGNFDIVLSIGVLHHIAEPGPVIRPPSSLCDPAAECLSGSTVAKAAAPTKAYSFPCARSHGTCRWS